MHGVLSNDDDRERGTVSTRRAEPPLTSKACTASQTLLPRPVASLVTLITQSTSLSLRLGAFLGGFAIDSARSTTLTGLELSRAVVEGILVRAGRDVVARSGDDYGRVEAETLLERSLATLHTTITSASFFASAGFHLSSVTLSSATTFSQNLLGALDATLGSTESSRAIAAFITLIRRELRNRDGASGEEKLRVGDLLVGMVGFALLQRWGRRKTEKETRENDEEEAIWDVVLLDNGLRADVVGIQRSTDARNTNDRPHTSERRPASFFSPDDAEDHRSFEAVERRTGSATGDGGGGATPLELLVPHVFLPADQQHQLSDDEIRQYIMEQLPHGSQTSIKTDTVTARTITVDLFDDEDLDIAPPPGTAVVEERFHPSTDISTKDSAVTGNQQPKHSVVFRTVANQSQTTDLRCEQRLSIEDRRSTEKEPSQGHHGKRPSSALSSSSASSNGGPETPKGPFGKMPFSKITHRVKANTEDKLGHKSPLKKFSRGSGNPNTSSDGSKSEEQGYFAGSSATGTATQPFSNTRAKRAGRPEDTKLTQPDSTNKPLPYAPPASAQANRAPTNASSARPNYPRRNSVASSCYSVRKESTESYVAQTDAYIHAGGIAPSSPVQRRNHVRSSSSLTRTKSDKDLPVHLDDGCRVSPTASRRGSTKPLTPSVYSMAAADSNTSLLLAPRTPKSVFEDQTTISALSRDGYVSGLFPSNHLAENVQRFCRFSSASYGSKFLRMMGISHRGTRDWRKESVDHQEHSSFCDHTGLPASTILLSSFVDTAGGSNSSGETAEGFPLVHYLSLDHESKAVVLTLRGTWGFEDILTDMTCDYDDLYWMGRFWQVHKGMHSSARRLLTGGAGRVMATTKAALERYPDYGVVFCGHSLGGGVAALLAILLSRPKEPGKPGPMFVTSSKHAAANPLLSGPGDSQNPQQRDRPSSSFCLPAGRPIHVYAYGPPAAISPSLRRATRGLITTVVNGQDVVPSLSLGTLHDLRAISLAFKHDMADAKSYVRSRVWERITNTIVNRFYVHQPPILIHAGDGVGEDPWAWSTLTSLRENLTANKLLPPGEVFVVETMRVLQRDAFTNDSFSTDSSPRLGRPATRVQLKYIRDVETRFREIKFGSGMFADHSPARYEASLAVLARGVLDD